MPTPFDLEEPLVVVPTPTRRTSRSAYTLLELTLVLAVISMTAALAVPSYNAFVAGPRLDAAVDSVRSGWATCRARAVAQGRPYRFSVVVGKGNYRIAPDNDEYWQGNNHPNDPQGAGFTLDDSLPKGVAFATQSQGPGEDGNTVLKPEQIGPGSWTPVCVFQPDGTVREDVEVAFRGKGTQGKVIHLRALTGSVTVQKFGGSK